MTGRQKITIGMCLVSVLILTGFFSQTQAQDRDNYLVRGSWSLQFGIADNFNLESFNGALISAKQHLSPNTALRFGITLSGRTGDFSSEDVDMSQNEPYYDSIIRTREGEISGASLNVTTQLMFYSAANSPVVMYFGIGPNFNYSRNKDEYDLKYIYEDLPDRDGTDYQYSRAWSLGLQGGSRHTVPGKAGPAGPSGQSRHGLHDQKPGHQPGQVGQQAQGTGHL